MGVIVRPVDDGVTLFKVWRSVRSIGKFTTGLAIVIATGGDGCRIYTVDGQIGWACDNDLITVT